MRAPARIALAAGLGLSVIPASSARADVVVKRTGPGFSAQLADSLVQALKSGPDAASLRVVELTGDWNTDSARVARGSEGQGTVYAIGPDATVAAAQTRGAHLIALAVPNPARLRTTATFVSMYPRLDKVFRFLGKTLNAKKVGFLYSPSQNTEMTAVFSEAAQRQGLTLVPVAVGSPGELVRGLRDALPGIDALLLPVDPILFDRQTLQIIVDESQKLKRPTVGFLEALPGLGVTASFVTPAASAASAAIEAARGRAVGPGPVEPDNPVLVVSRRGAQAIGLSPEAMGAQKIE